MDTDGHVSLACGGDDCNDNNNAVHPGAADNLEGFDAATTMVDPAGGHGQWMTAAVDSQGVYHAAWYNPTARVLHHASNRFGHWEVAVLDSSSADVGQFAELRLDGAGKVHVVYVDTTSRALKYATNLTGQWTRETITTAAATRSLGSPSLAVSSDGTVHVAYRDYASVANSSLMYTARAAGSWAAPQTVEAGGLAASLALLGGVPRIAHRNGAGAVRFAAQLGVAWNTVDVDTANTGTGNDADIRLVISPAGEAHVVYRSNGAGVRHARLDGTNWRVGDVDPDNGAVTSAARRYDLVVDAAGRVDTCYTLARTNVSGTTYEVTHASSVVAPTVAAPAGLAANFLKRTVRAGLSTGTWCALTLSTAGVRGLFFHAPAQDESRFQDDNTAVPGVELLQGQDNVGAHVAAARTAAGVLHVVYRDDTTAGLRHTWLVPGSTWMDEAVDDGITGNVGLWPSLAVAADGTLHVSYQDVTNTDLKYATQPPGGGAWTVTTVETSVPNNLGPGSAMALMAGDEPAIAYLDTTTNNLKLARHGGGAWTLTLVTSGVTANRPPHMLVDGGGRFVITRYRATAPAGQVVTWGTPNDGWTDLYLDAGTISAAALDAGAGVHVVTAAATTLANHYALLYSGGVYTASAAESVPRPANVVVPGGVDLRLSATGTLVAVFAGNNGITRTERSTAWTPATTLTTASATAAALVTGPGLADWHVLYVQGGSLRRVATDLHAFPATETTFAFNGTVTGQNTATAVDILGVPHVVYQDATQNAVRYAHTSEGLWFTADVERGASNLGAFTSLAAGADGTVHFAYYDNTASALRYAVLAAGTFTAEEVDNAADVGRHPSLALDTAGLPRIAYRDQTATAVRYATRSAGGVWTVAAPLNGGAWGDSISLATDSANHAHLVFKDATSGTTNNPMYTENSLGAFATPVAVEATASQNDGNYLSLAMDRTNHACVVHYDQTARSLRFQTNRVGNAFAGVTADAPVGGTETVGTFATLHLDGADHAYVGYRRASAPAAGRPNGVIMATDFSGSWQNFPLVTSATAQFQSMGRSPGNVFFVSYHDANRLNVVRATVRNALDNNCDGY